MFYHTKINDDELPNLAKVTSLESLGLIGSKRIHGKGFQHLISLNNLRSLNLAASNSTDQAIPFLAQLPALEELDLSFTEVTAKGLEEFSTAPRLRQLTVPRASSTFFLARSAAA